MDYCLVLMIHRLVDNLVLRNQWEKVRGNVSEFSLPCPVFFPHCPNVGDASPPRRSCRTMFNNKSMMGLRIKRIIAKLLERIKSSLSILVK